MPTPRAIVAIVGAWLVLLAIATAAVLYPLGPLFQRREQHQLLRTFRVDVQQAADAKEGLEGLLNAEKPLAPEVGQSVAILDLGRVRVQQVVIEGVGPDQTRRGPGHVPGTAGLGQPGNSVVVGRRSGWGGPFDGLGSLRAGDEIVTTTVQGQSVYVVRTVEERRLDPEAQYGPSDDDRLTLVTSAGRWPWATDRAIVVEARLEGRPFEPTPQGGRVASADGRRGDTGGWAPLALFGAGFAGAAVAAAVLYRRWRPLTAYLLTTPAVVVMAILTGESVLRLLPAWA
jgi:sortase A